MAAPNGTNNYEQFDFDEVNQVEVELVDDEDDGGDEDDDALILELTEQLLEQEEAEQGFISEIQEGDTYESAKKRRRRPVFVFGTLVVAVLENDTEYMKESIEKEPDTVFTFLRNCAQLGFVRPLILYAHLGFDLGFQRPNGDNIFLGVAEKAHNGECGKAWANVFHRSWESRIETLIPYYLSTETPNRTIYEQLLQFRHTLLSRSGFFHHTTNLNQLYPRDFVSPFEVLCVVNFLAIRKSLSWRKPLLLYEELISPLHYASRQGCAVCTQQMIIWNADINEKTSDGLTPIFHCAYLGHAESIALLVQAGCDLWVRSVDDEWTRSHGNYSKTALDYALSEFFCNMPNCGCHTQGAPKEKKNQCAQLLAEEMKAPRSLKVLCRNRIHEILMQSSPEKVDFESLKEDVPDDVIDYLRYHIV